MYVVVVLYEEYGYDSEDSWTSVQEVIGPFETSKEAYAYEKKIPNFYRAETYPVTTQKKGNT